MSRDFLHKIEALDWRTSFFISDGKSKMKSKLINLHADLQLCLRLRRSFAGKWRSTTHAIKSFKNKCVCIENCISLSRKSQTRSIASWRNRAFQCWKHAPNDAKLIIINYALLRLNYDYNSMLLWIEIQSLSPIGVSSERIYITVSVNVNECHLFANPKFRTRKVIISSLRRWTKGPNMHERIHAFNGSKPKCHSDKSVKPIRCRMSSRISQMFGKASTAHRIRQHTKWNLFHSMPQPFGAPCLALRVCALLLPIYNSTQSRSR